MTSTYTANQGIEKMDTGDQSGTWGGTVNTNMDIIDRAISGVVSITLTGSSTTLTTTDGTLTDGMYRVLVLIDGGDLGSDNTLTISPNDQDKAYLVYNNLSADRNAIFTQGTGANATIQNGETAWIYADGGGSGAIVRTAVSSVKITDQDGDTQIQVEEGGDDDDTIRFDIAGAEDFTMTANTFNVLTGSDLNINSGGTLTNAGTAYGFDNLPAFAGVLETNATFVDQVIFGPAVDGMAWNGKWTANDSDGDLLYTSLMLATIEDATDDTQINIWDLTEQSAGVISTTVIKTITLSDDDTPTSIAASMGYLIIGSEDGISIVDPHSGAWAERTKGWPRTLSTSTTPALDSNDVVMVAAGVAGVSPYDPRTGGYIPCFGALYASGESKTASLIKHDGNVWDITGTAPATGVVGFQDEDFIFPRDATDTRRYEVEIITADLAGSAGDSYWDSDAWPQAFAATTAFSASGIHSAAASTSGAVIRIEGDNKYTTGLASISRIYNTGFLVGSIRGAWLASTSADADNEGEKDRSYHGNNLTQNNTPTEGEVASSAELDGYSGFTASVNFTAASNAEWDVITTGAAYLTGWFKSTGNSGVEDLFGFGKSDDSITFFVRLQSSGVITGFDRGSTAADRTVASTQTYDDSVWHKIDFVRNSSTDRALYIDGVLIAVNTDDAGSLSSSGNLPFAVGVNYDGSSVPAASSSIALVKLSTYAPSAALVRQMYDAEKGMFVASAKCVLQSDSTDAVLDVDVDPLTNKVIVTQTDNITVWDGLVVDSEPTVNSGASEKGKLWGDLRAEQNSANAYVTAPATDQRQVNEMVRGLASDLPAGIDLSKAKAWGTIPSGAGSISESYNVKSVTLNATGQVKIEVAIPFKTATYVILANANSRVAVPITGGNQFKNTFLVYIYDIGGAGQSNSSVTFACFGELENE